MAQIRGRTERRRSTGCLVSSDTVRRTCLTAERTGSATSTSPFRLKEQFDVATNFGTAEHVFNIGNMFRSVHDVLRPGGVALHILPTFGDIDHGFFNIHPTTYLDLAAANDYVIEDFCYVDRWDIRDKVFAADFKSDFDFDALPIRLDQLKDRPKLQRMVTELFIENYRREDTQRIGQQYPGVFYDYCCVAIRKTGSAAFRIPMQGYYGGGAAIERMEVRPILAAIRHRRKNFAALRRAHDKPCGESPIRSKTSCAEVVGGGDRQRPYRDSTPAYRSDFAIRVAFSTAGSARILDCSA